MCPDSILVRTIVCKSTLIGPHKSAGVKLSEEGIMCVLFLYGMMGANKAIFFLLEDIYFSVVSF